jgi:hypothetical protein
MHVWAAVLTGVAALALPAQAVAHGRSATIALDYDLRLDPSTQALAGVHVRVLDGDRALEARVDPGVNLLVRGALREPLLRIDAAGVWVNASSPTATGDGLISDRRSGWVRVSSGRSIAWHDHRLAPPPVTTPGPAGRFAIPVAVDGRRAVIGGVFFRVARPALWPWLAGAAGLVVGIALAIRHRPLRFPLTIGLGLAGGLAALVAVTTFAVRDAPTGGVGWLQIGVGIAIAAVLAGLLVRLRGKSRVHAAGVIGAVGAAVSLSLLSVFWHGVVVSALPSTAARAVCGLALVCGAAAATLSFLPDFDEPARVAR